MMRRRLLAVAFAFCSLGVLAGAGTIYASSDQAPASIAGLAGKSREMDGIQVRLVAEAVGDVMVRGDYAWLNVLDASGSAIGVYLQKDEALKVRILGSYFWKGDVVDLTGTFHYACPEHDGDPDIHADSLAVVEQGHRVYHPVETSRAVFGSALIVLAGVMGLAVRTRTSQPVR